MFKLRNALTGETLGPFAITELATVSPPGDPAFWDVELIPAPASERRAFDRAAEDAEMLRKVREQAAPMAAALAE